MQHKAYSYDIAFVCFLKKGLVIPKG